MKLARERHEPAIAKHPVEIFSPTLEVVVAEPRIFNPESVVVPKPIEETESWVAVVEPTTKPTDSPACGETEKRARSDVVDIPTRPVLVTSK